MAEEFSILRLAFMDIAVDLLSPNGNGAHVQTGGYAPGVHRRRKGRAGGLGVHQEVDEVITVNINGETPAACLAVLSDIAYILDQADAWQWPRATQVEPPRLICRPLGSNEADPLIGYIIGSGDRSMLDLPATFNDLLEVYEITGIKINIRRMPWLGAIEETDATPALTMPAIATATFPTSQNTPSPVQVTISSSMNLDAFPGIRIPDSYLFITNTPDRLAILEAENSTGQNFGPISAPYSVVSGMINGEDHKASGGYLLKFTGNNNIKDFQPLGATYIGGNFATFGNQRVACYAVLQVADDDEGAVAIQWRAGSNTYELFSAPPVELNRTDQEKPQIVYLGTIFVSDGVAVSQIAIKDHWGQSKVLIDYFVFIALDDVTSRVIAIDGRSREGLVYTLPTDIQTSAWWRTQRAQVYAHNERTALPDVDAPLGHLGRPDLVSTGNAISTLWIAAGNEDTDYFRPTNNNTPLTVNMRARRSPLSLVPQ